MTRFVVASIAALGLGSCGQPATAPNEVAGNRSDTSASIVATPKVPPFTETPRAAPEPAPIPAKFRGGWADSKAACADPKHHSRMTISGRSIRHPDFVMVGDSVTASEDQFTLEGHFEETKRRAEAQFFINQAGDVLTDGGGGGAIRVRCG